MKISYAICVCNEHPELNALLSFLTDVIDNEDEINILVDSGKVTDEVHSVLGKFEDRIVVHKRKFCGNFSKHRNYHITKCTGDYIFVLDADEIPQEALIKNIKTFDGEGEDLYDYCNDFNYFKLDLIGENSVIILDLNYVEEYDETIDLSDFILCNDSNKIMLFDKDGNTSNLDL